MIEAPNADGWPDPVRPGVPESPGRDGWHWVLGKVGPVGGDFLTAMFWRAKRSMWLISNNYTSASEMSALGCTRYLGPVAPPGSITPAHHAEAIQAARAEERERCAAFVETHTVGTICNISTVMLRHKQDGGGPVFAAAIRALPSTPAQEPSNG